MDAADVATTTRELVTCLQDDLYVSDVGLVDGLIEEGYLSSDDWRAIHAVKRHKKKVKILIKRLAKSKCPHRAFECLRDKLAVSHAYLIPRVSAVIGRLQQVSRNQAGRVRPVEHDDTVPQTSDNDHVETDNPNNVANSDYNRLGTSKEVCEHSEDNISSARSCLRENGTKSLSCAHLMNGYKYTENSKSCVLVGKAENKNGRKPEPVENSWRSDVNNNDINASCQLLRKAKQCNSPFSNQIRGNWLSRREMCRFECSSNGKDENTYISPRNGEEHSYYSTDDVDAACQLANTTLNGSENHYQCVEHTIGNASKRQFYENACQTYTSNYANHRFEQELDKHIQSSFSGERQSYPLINLCETGSSFGEKCMQAYDENSLCCRNSRCIDNVSPIAVVAAGITKSRELGPCWNCILSRRNIKGHELHRRNREEVNHNRSAGRCTGYNQQESGVLALSSSSDTDSDEVNTEVVTSELDDDELKLFGEINGGDISDFVDVFIQSGMLSSDDYNLIHGTASRRRKSAILARILSQNANERTDRPEAVENIDSDNTGHFNEVDSCLANYGEMNIALQRPLHSSGQIVIKDLDVVFDKFNTMLNNGVLKIGELPEDPNIRCIIHFLQACKNLYVENFEEAKKHIKTTDALLPKTAFPVQLRGEIFTAKTWLCLSSNKLGKMLRLLEENEQYLLSFPGGWTNKAKGWFYYDFGRCYQAMLVRTLFQGTRKYSERTQEWYRQRAMKCAKKAVDFFRVSDSSDGPIGSGFALCQLADLHLLCYSVPRVHDDSITNTDLQSAGAAIEKVEQLPGGIPDVLKANCLISKSRLMVRAGDLSSAHELANEAMELSQRLSLKLEMKDSIFLLDHIGSLDGNRKNFKRDYKVIDDSSSELSYSE